MTNDYPRVELWYGDLRVTQAHPPDKWHGQAKAAAAHLIGSHNKAKEAGRTFCESGVLLRQRPDVLFGPAIGFYRNGRGEGHADYFVGGPDLVVEICSPSNTQRQITKKVDIYFRYGTRLAWVVDLIARRVVVHTPDAAARVLEEDATLDGGDVLPGFSCKVAELLG